MATRPQSVELDLGHINIREKRDDPVYQGIRIKSHVLNDSTNISPEVMGFLVTALDGASKYLKQAILVERLQVNLKFRPNCTISSDNSSECDCGVSVSGALHCGPVTIPAEHVGMATVQPNRTCGLNGTGVEDADTVIYITAISDGKIMIQYVFSTSNQPVLTKNVINVFLCCPRALVYSFAAKCTGSASPVVFGAACLTDPQLQDRPVAGYLNFCPDVREAN